MPKSLGKLLNEAFTKAGVANDDPKLMALLQNKELATIQIEDDLLTPFEGNLHSIDSAKAKLKSQLFKEAYGGLDLELARAFDELELDDATKAELNAETSSQKRAVKLAKKIKELESAKAKAAPADKKELTDEINKLKQEKADLAKAKDAEKAALAADKDKEIDSLDEDLLLSGYDLHIPVGLTKQDILIIAKNKLNAAMSAEGLRTVRENGRRKLVTKDGTDYFDKTQTKKDLNSFTESILAHHKLLKTAETGNTGQGNTTPPVILPGGKQPDQNQLRIISDLDAKIAAAQVATE